MPIKKSEVELYRQEEPLQFLQNTRMSRDQTRQSLSEQWRQGVRESQNVSGTEEQIRITFKFKGVITPP